VVEDLKNDGSATICLHSGLAIHYIEVNSSTLWWSVLGIQLSELRTTWKILFM